MNQKNGLAKGVVSNSLSPFKIGELFQRFLGEADIP